MPIAKHQSDVPNGSNRDRAPTHHLALDAYGVILMLTLFERSV